MLFLLFLLYFLKIKPANLNPNIKSIQWCNCEDTSSLSNISRCFLTKSSGEEAQVGREIGGRGGGEEEEAGVKIEGSVKNSGTHSWGVVSYIFLQENVGGGRGGGNRRRGKGGKPVNNYNTSPYLLSPTPNTLKHSPILTSYLKGIRPVEN